MKGEWPAQGRRGGDSITTIKIQNLSKFFGSHQALKDINLEVKKGEFIAIFGPNGAGKTTLIKIISTLISPTSGAIFINEQNIKEKSLEARKQIGAISHDTYLYESLTAYENLMFYGRMYGVQNLENKIETLLEQVGLKARRNDRVATYSRGMKQRLSIARAVLHNPEILLLDEPYTGLDQQASRTFEKILADLYGSEKEKTTIMTTHDLERGLQMCNRAIILNNGKIVYDAARSEISSLEQFRERYETLIGG